jgi:phosphate starvation-inducible PhoH-like protein
MMGNNIEDNKMPHNPRSRKRDELPVLPELAAPKYSSTKVFKPLNKSQETYLNKIQNNQITFGLGPAGTGKTFVAAMAAAEALKSKKVDRIIISRPVVEAGESLGFLPGDMNEKFTPYIQPFLEALSRILGSGHVEALVNNQRIVFLPLAYMRGWSFENTFVILDEAQNATKSQLKLFLTRIGKNCSVVVDGDGSQRDIDVNGLQDAVERLASVRGVAIHTFQVSDIVRSGIVADIIRAYSGDFDYAESEDQREGLNTFLNNS